MLNDTDFDGIDDNKELGDEDKTTGRFRGNAREISRVDYTNDFRYFFIDNDKYNDELAVMSLMIANGKYVNTDQVNANDIHQYIQKIGFTNIWQKDSFRISDTETIRGKLYVGKKTIQYRVYASKDDNVGRNAYKDVYGIFLMDFDNETNMKYLLANFNVKSGYVVDKIVKINSDNSETNFDFDQVATLGDRSDESNELLAEYDRVIAEATPLYEAYYEILKKRMEKQKSMVTYGDKTWEEFIALPEIKDLMEKEKVAYARYEEVIKNLPDEDHAWDLRLRVKWKGKTIHSRFDYNGNRSGNYKVDPTTATMTSKDVTYGKAVGALPTPRKTGYTFKGWKTGRDLFTQYNLEGCDINYNI